MMNVKNLTLILIFVLGSLIAITKVLAAEDTIELSRAAVVELTAKMNIRSSMRTGTKTNIIRTLKKGTRVNVIREEQDDQGQNWLFIQMPTGEWGYMVKSIYKQTPHKPAPGAPNTANNPGVANATPHNVPTGSVGLLMPLCGCTHERCRLISRHGYRPWPRRVYGKRRGKQFHKGTDFGAPFNQPLRAAQDGIVTSNTGFIKDGYGGRVTIAHRTTLINKHGKTISKNGFETQYSHMKKVYVKRGQRVSKGQIIGTVGSTGFSAGPHLDMIIRANNKLHDAMDFFTSNQIENKKYGSGVFAKHRAIGNCPTGIGNSQGITSIGSRD